MCIYMYMYIFLVSTTQGVIPPRHPFFFLIFIYFFGCSRSQLQQAPQLQLQSSLVVAPRLLSCGMRTLSFGTHVGSSSLTRDRTLIGSMESYPLRQQGGPFFSFFNIYLFGCARSQLRHLGSSLPRAGSSLWHAGSLVVACKLLVAACGIQFPDQGSNWGPQHWECRASATGPPEKSLVILDNGYLCLLSYFHDWFYQRFVNFISSSKEPILVLLILLLIYLFCFIDFYFHLYYFLFSTVVFLL